MSKCKANIKVIGYYVCPLSEDEKINIKIDKLKRKLVKAYKKQALINYKKINK